MKEGQLSFGEKYPEVVKLIIVIFCMGFSINAICQSDIVKFRLLIERNKPLSGSMILVKDSNPLIATTTDMYGKAELRIDPGRVISIISPVGPYIEFALPHPGDSVFLNIRNKKVKFFFKNRKTGKLKLNIATPF